uniref:Ig-like domain-containing protein n=1 Tax=Oreochromis aureus TaxID=47969 RepID=A0A668SUT7_OREAU
MGQSLLCTMGFYLLSTVIYGNAEAGPKPTVTLQPSRTHIYSGETVTVRCEIQGGEGAQWTYEWRAEKLNTRQSSNEYRIIKVTESDGGEYRCRGRSSSSWTEWSDITTLTILHKPKAQLRADRTAVPAGGSVILTCSVSVSSSSSGWKYYWYRYDKYYKLVTLRDGVFLSNRQISVSEGGLYRCRGGRGEPVYYTEYSETIKIAKPKAELRADSTAVPVGGSVTLTCSVSPSSSSSGWKYYWYRDGKSYQILTNGQISVSEGGLYWCRGGRGEPVYYTEYSKSVWIDTTVSNRSVVTLHPNWSEIYRGETITVRCEIHGGDTEWDYEWETNNIIKPPNQNEYRIRSASSSNSGNYRCKGRMKSSQHKTTEWSDSVTLTVSDNKPKAELRADRTAVPVGGSVTLTCSVNPSSSSSSSSSRWKYYWYRYDSYYKLVTSPDAVFLSNGQISVSEGGRYSCRGGRGEPVYYTEDSESVWIDTTVSNRPVVTLYPNWSEIYRGETITVRCEIHGGDTEWDYEWETNSTIKPPNQSEYRIRSASSSKSGNYRCKGRMKSSQHKTTEWSDSVTLTVSDNKPRPVLTVSPSWLSPGASVTLNCEVEHPSAGWSFYWYKAVPDLSQKSSSYELLPDGSGTAQDSYIIHGQTHTAGYVCRAGRGDPEYHTDHSQPKFV